MKILNRGITWLQFLFSQAVWTPQKWILESVAVWKTHKKWKRSVWVPGFLFCLFGVGLVHWFFFPLKVNHTWHLQYMRLTQEEQKNCFDVRILFCSPWLNVLFPSYQQSCTDWVTGRAEKGIKELGVPNVWWLSTPIKLKGIGKNL